MNHTFLFLAVKTAISVVMIIADQWWKLILKISLGWLKLAALCYTKLMRYTLEILKF